MYENQNSEVVLVLGMHRSGTSLITKAVTALGYSPGNNLIAAREDNPTGFWEDADILDINEQILESLALTWNSIEVLPIRKIHYFAELLWDNFGGKAISIIKRKMAINNKLVLKDPRMCLTLPFWEKVFNQLGIPVKHLFVQRNPLDIAKSLQKRNGYELEFSLRLWYKYSLFCLTDLKGEIHWLDYNLFLQNPESALKSIAIFLNTSFEPESTAINEVLHQFVDSDLNHHTSTDSELVEIAKEMSSVLEMHRLLQEALINSEIQPIIEEKIAHFIKHEHSSLYSEYQPNHYTIRLTADSQDIFHEKTISTPENTLQFNFEKSIQTNKLSLWLADNPCLLHLNKIEIYSGAKVFSPNEISGNFIYTNKGWYLYNSNKPLIELHCDEKIKIHSIKLSFTLFFNMPLVGQYILAYRNLTYTLQQKSLENLTGVKKTDSLQLTFQIKALEEQVSAIKKSISWQVTAPLRWFGNVLLSFFKLFPRASEEMGYALELLRREGFSSFMYRLFWYLRGKRLPEDIFFAQTRKKNTKEAKTIRITLPIVFEQHEHPLVSIIIPVHNQWEYTLRCLASIKENTQNIPYEVIVADDASTDETSNIDKYIQNITVIRNHENLHFLRNCNHAATFAKGSFLHFLNNDTIVKPGWLSSIIELAERNPIAGIIGSKLIYPNGKLQEAGGIIWNDGSGWNFGRNSLPDLPEYNYVKEVDYVSGASLLIKKKLWDELFGFDELFIPAYYEDTDLAFRMRTKGYSVLYQPQSEVIHFEGISHGNNVKEGIKKHQIENLQKFISRWKDQLMNEHIANSEQVFLARDRSSSRKHILVIDHYVPQYDKDAGSRSTFSYLMLMAEMGYQITFVGDNFQKTEPYTAQLQQAGIEVLYGSYSQNNFKNWLRKNGKYFDYVFLHRAHIASKHINTVKKYSNAKILYVGHDLNTMAWQRNYQISGNESDLKESVRYSQIENELFKQSDVILPFSTVEASEIGKMAPDKRVITLPVFFYQNIFERTTSFDDTSDLLFVGGFAHPPNLDAFKWLVDEILPLVTNQLPNVKLYVVGSNPPAEVTRYQSEHIIITGYVTEAELQHYYKKCRLAILPLRKGAGVKGKLIEALYHQIPSVVTPVAAEGIPEIEKYTTICDTSQSFAQHVIRLYSDKNYWNWAQQGCKKLIDKYYSESRAKDQIINALR